MSAVSRVQRCFVVSVEWAEAEDKWSHRLDHTSIYISCLLLDRNTSPVRLEGSITFTALLPESRRVQQRYTTQTRDYFLIFNSKFKSHSKDRKRRYQCNINENQADNAHVYTRHLTSFHISTHAPRSPHKYAHLHLFMILLINMVVQMTALC